MYAIDVYQNRAVFRFRAMFRFLLSSTLLLIVFQANAQLRQRIEVGGGVGMMNYTGDMTRNYQLSSGRPAATVFYRNNISSVVSLRSALTFGSISANDKLNPIDPAALQRDNSFKLSMMEFSPVFEYHFLDWRSGKNPIRFTPYLMAGGAIFLFTGNKEKPRDYSNMQVAIPFGGGAKFVLNPYWYLAVEIGIRKTFFDYLDNISDGDPALKNYRYGNPFDTDNYFFTGFTISHTFYEIPCPSSPYK